MYKCSSGSDGGTLYQLRNLLNRRNVTKDPSSNVTADEEFFLLVTEAHIISAAMKLFGMTSIEDEPSSVYFPAGSSDLDSLQRRNILLLATRNIASKYVDLKFCERAEKKKKKKKEDNTTAGRGAAAATRTGKRL